MAERLQHEQGIEKQGLGLGKEVTSSLVVKVEEICFYFDMEYLKVEIPVLTHVVVMNAKEYYCVQQNVCTVCKLFWKENKLRCWMRRSVTVGE